MPLPACTMLSHAGVAGVDQTVDQMSRLAMGPRGAKSGFIRDLALSIVREAGVAERDQPGEVAAIHRWVQRSIRYVRDPIGLELLTYPEDLVKVTRAGDCDDHSILEAAFLGALGMPTRFVVVGFTGPNAFSHVYLEALVRGLDKRTAWVPLDPIVKDQPPGYEVPNATARKIYPTNSDDGLAVAAGAVGLSLVVGWALWWWLGSGGRR